MENTILEALNKLLDENQVKEISEAVDSVLADAKKELETEFESKLDEAYADFSKQLKEAEEVAEQGYQQAYEIIQDYQRRIDMQKAEFDKALEEGYEEAYQHILKEKEKSQNLEVEMHEAYEKKTEELHDWLVDKVDQFLEEETKKIYEQSRRELLSDPRLADHKVALDKIAETISYYCLDNEDLSIANQKKLEETTKQLEDLRGQLRLVEARNIRLSSENNKLNESLRHTQEVVSEQTTAIEKANLDERIDESKKAVARGQSNFAKDEQIVVETNKSSAKKSQPVLVEGFKPEMIEELQILSGIKK